MLNFYQKRSGRSLEIKRLSRAAWTTVTVCLLLGCEVSSSWSPTEGLAETLAFAEVDRERGQIDLGTPSARPSLIDGWSWDATAGDGTTYAWAMGPRSELEVFLAIQRDLRLSFRCLAFTYPGAPVQKVTVRWDDRALGSFDLGGDFTQTELTLSADLALPGGHRLSLVPAYTEQPSRVGAGEDRRDLSFACDWIRVGDGTEAESPKADADTLWLPAGARVSYFLEPDGPRRLGWEALSARGAATGLVVEWQAEGSEAVAAEVNPSSSSGHLALPLPPGEPRPVRLTLRAQATAMGGGVVLRRPAVLSEATVASSPEPDEARPDAVPKGEPIGRPPIVVWVVDTLRVDRLGVYGHPRPTSPHFDALAARSTVFERAMAQSSWTRPTMATLVTGVGPEGHGIHGVDHGLNPSFETLAEVLSRAGYVTGGFSANGNFSPDTQLDQGFEHFEYLVFDVDQVAQHAVNWLDRLKEQGDDRPPFLMLLTTEPHASFEPKGPFRERFASGVKDPWIGTSEHIRALGDKKSPATDEVVTQLFDLYDAEIAWNDAAFGTFRERLAERGLEPLVVIVADHGEAFRERGVFGHGWDLHREVLQVPFWIHLPEQREARRVVDPVQQSDVLPTLLDLLGLDQPEAVEGSSLRPYLIDGGADRSDLADRLLVSTMDYEGRAGAALIRGRYKLIEPMSENFADGRLLYDQVDDPTESENLVLKRPILAGRLARLLREALAERQGTGADEVELDPETRKQLEALGYIDG